MKLTLFSQTGEQGEKDPEPKSNRKIVEKDYRRANRARNQDGTSTLPSWLALIIVGFTCNHKFSISSKVHVKLENEKFVNFRTKR